MAQDSAQIRVAADGEIHVAPLATTAPTDPSAAYAAGWIDLGYATEDGVTMTAEAEIEEIRVWQEFYPARHIITARSLEVSFTLRQWNYQTIPLAFGGGTVSEPSAGVFKWVPPSPETLDERELGITWRDGSYDYRLIIPKGRVTGAVETQLTRGDAANLPVTFAAVGTTGVDVAYILTDDPAFDATP